jgi:hypothetical protein
MRVHVIFFPKVTFSQESRFLIDVQMLFARLLYVISFNLFFQPRTTTILIFTHPELGRWHRFRTLSKTGTTSLHRRGTATPATTATCAPSCNSFKLRRQRLAHFIVAASTA